MKYIFLFLIFLCPYSLFAATGYTDTNGTKISIDRPLGLPQYVDTYLDEKIYALIGDAPTIEITEDMSGSIMDPRNWEYDFDVRKVYENDQILSLLMTTYQYTGGAHGSSGRFGIVFDKKTGKQLMIEDIFRERSLVYRLGPVWRSQIAHRIESLIGPIDQMGKNWIREGTIDITQYHSFTLTDKFLTIYGQEYQHVPYAYGMQTLRYPLFRLKDIMR